MTDIPEIPEQEQKTYDSEPLTPEEFLEVQGNLFQDDIEGGLQNIEVPPEAMQEIRDQYESAAEHINIPEGSEGSELPHKTDEIYCSFTPEEMMILREVLEKHSLNMTGLEYLYEEGVGEKYDQQAIIRFIRDKVDMSVDRYVKIRPYNPFLVRWVKRIGKEHVRKM